MHSFLPLQIGEGVPIFEIWTKTGFMKKLLRNMGLVEMGLRFLRKGGFPNCFITF